MEFVLDMTGLVLKSTKLDNWIFNLNSKSLALIALLRYFLNRSTPFDSSILSEVVILAADVRPCLSAELSREVQLREQTNGWRDWRGPDKVKCSQRDSINCMDVFYGVSEEEQ